MLEPDTLDRIPRDTVYSIERGYFPSLVENGETFVAHIDRGYWIDIGTPEKYRQAHRDIMDGRFVAPPFAGSAGTAVVSPDARVEDGAVIEGPCFIDAGTVVKSGARIGAVQCHRQALPHRRQRRDRRRDPLAEHLGGHRGQALRRDRRPALPLREERGSWRGGDVRRQVGRDRLFTSLNAHTVRSGTRHWALGTGRS